MPRSTGQPSAAAKIYLLSGKPYAFLIAFVSAVGGFLFGYDLAIMGGANVILREQFHLTEFWFGFTTASAILGCIVGPFFGGWCCDRWGRRNTLIGACLLLAIGSLFTAIPNDMITFNIFRIVGGLGVGFCSIASPMYTNEIAPARWRGGLGFMYQLAIVVACGLVDRFGRRPLWLIGSLVMIVANIAIGLVFHFGITGPIVLVAIFLCAIPHSLALGPLPWLMMSEIFPTRIRARAVAITTTFIWLVGYLASSLFPVLADCSNEAIGSIAGVFWLSGAVCVLAFLFGLMFLPETRGRTLEEIGDCWQRPA